MDIVKSPAWDAELLEGGLGMRLNLGRLASNTLFGPDPYLLLQAIPNELTGDQFPCVRRDWPMSWLDQTSNKHQGTYSRKYGISCTQDFANLDLGILTVKRNEGKDCLFAPM